ncbi:MAG TPA: hypothetical protein V6C52_01565 [Coleofasciculaceae cyanobacterium]|jgi:hypothetical protein
MSLNPQLQPPEPHLQAVESQPEDNLAAQDILHAIQSQGSWFFWIAGLSVVNSIGSLLHLDMAFVVGLGFSLILGSLAAELGEAWSAIAITLNLAIIGFFAAMGYFAIQGGRWAFMLGILIYALDAIALVLLQDWFMVAFHGYVLFQLGAGLAVCFKQNQ